MELTYTEAQVFLSDTNLPIYYKKGEEFISENSVHFMLNDFLIIAKIKPYCLPREISDHPKLKELIIDPIIKKMPRMLHSNNCSLSRLKSLANKGVVYDSFKFSRTYRKNKTYLANKIVTNLYDSSKKIKGNKGWLTPKKLFDILFQFKGIHKNILKKTDLKFVDLAEDINKDNLGQFFIVGENLEEAVEKAIQIYDMGERLKNFI